MSQFTELNDNRIYSELEQTLDKCSDKQIKSMSVHELRSFRNKIQSAEVSISVARRVAQGWLDTILLEKQKLSEPENEELVAPDMLPDLITLLTATPGIEHEESNPRLAASLFDASNCDSDLLGLMLNILDKILVTKDMSVWFEESSQMFEETVANIASFEKELSKTRKRCHKSIDSLQDELVNRIKSGEVKVDEIIK